MAFSSLFFEGGNVKNLYYTTAAHVNLGDNTGYDSVPA